MSILNCQLIGIKALAFWTLLLFQVFWSIGRFSCNQRLLRDSPNHKETTEVEPSRAAHIPYCKVTGLASPRASVLPQPCFALSCTLSSVCKTQWASSSSIFLCLFLAFTPFCVTASIACYHISPLFLFSLKYVSVQWIFALICSHAITVVLSVFFLFTFLSISSYLLFVTSVHTRIYSSTCQVPHTD